MKERAWVSYHNEKAFCPFARQAGRPYVYVTRARSFARMEEPSVF